MTGEKTKVKSGQYSLATSKDFAKELVAATPSQKNWAGIVISLFVICAVCGLILFSIYLLRPPDDGPRVKGRKVFLNDTISNRFNLPPFNGSWISENELIFRDYLGGLSILNADSLISRPFVSNTTFRQLDAHKYSVSPDRQFILLIHDVQPVWEHSYLAKYTLYDIENEHQFPLSPFQNMSRTGDTEQPEFQHVEWGPLGNSLILIYENDIFYKSNVKSPTISRITKSGEGGVYFNGIPDWIYEVEILKSNKAIWLSPTGETLLYASFDDKEVGEAIYSWYGDNFPYPLLRKLRYPKAGTPNPKITLWTVNLSSIALNSVPIKPPLELESKEHYVTAVEWVDSLHVSVIWMNRDQNMSILSLCEGKQDWECRTIYTLHAKPPGSGWLEFTPPPIFSSNLSSCLLRIPWRDGEAGYFSHIVWLDISSFREIPITHGPFEVIEISAWDQFNHLIYFIAVPPGKPGERHLYRASEKSSNSTTITSPICLTCPTISVQLRNSKSSSGSIPNDDLIMQDFQTSSTESSVEGVRNSSLGYEQWSTGRNRKSQNHLHKFNFCLFNQVIFSPKKDFFVRACMGPGVPTDTLHSAASGRLLMILNNNTAVKQEVADLGLPLVRTFPVEILGGYRVPVRLFLPPGFREHEDFKFPFVLHVAGGPGSQIVSEKWSLSWSSYLTSQKNFIVVEMDGRGTGFQGEALRHSVYRKLGTVGIEDQLEVVKYLRDQLDFIDRDNMAVYGHGYGAYVALLILAADTTKIFRCGIAISPITKWEFYNSVFTERIMGMPNTTDNFRGYEEGDVTRIVKALHARNFLIIHGTADEKVHYQHTLHLTKALINEGVPFTEQVYPDENHKLSGVVEHLYSTMESYLDRNFDVIDWEDWEKANFLGIKI